ncbi:MAG: hypothetical protein IKE52_02480 [Mogibacterium sp.]|nr:hypothetical protein [Mogibacterium sp.]
MIASQEPRIKVEPRRVATDGTDAALLMAEYGNELDPWQGSVVDCWLGRDEEGKLTTTSAGLSVPRQNGKNVCLEAREFYGLTILGEKILHTAHQVRTSKKAFRRLSAMFEDKRHPEIIGLVKQIRRTNGEEAIELWNGGTIEYSSRSRQSARGIEGISLVVFDEAQELTDDQVESIIATLAASATGTRQIIYTGTPPYPSCPGEVFRRIRKSIIDSQRENSAWHEWSVEGDGIDDIDIKDRKLWYMTNPALGRRLTEKYTEEECESETRAGFARERLGWWMPERNGDHSLAIDSKAWGACMSLKKKPEGKTAYGIKFSADSTEVCLCGAIIPEEGQARISLIAIKNTVDGMQWLADWLNERPKEASCVVIDGKNGVDVLIDKIAAKWRVKGSIIRAKSADMIAAAGLIVNAINEEGLTWYHKHEPLDESARTATKRMIGTGGGWGFGGEYSLPIEAASLAYFGAKTSRRNPKKKMRIG